MYFVQIVRINKYDEKIIIMIPDCHEKKKASLSNVHYNVVSGHQLELYLPISFVSPI